MKKTLIMLIVLLTFVAASAYAMDAKEQMQGYALHNQYCLSCHDSVADPEKPGFTQDTWFLIINIMHEKYGMQSLPADDKGKLTEYLYTIRQGIEREAG
jgi:uncharacterized protein YxeA